jgi:hypothetical protein
MTTVPPEALGPGTPDPSGQVAYGVRAPAGSTFVPSPVPPEQREANRAEAERNARCPRCMALDDGLVAAATAALRAAREEGRRGR